MGPEVNPLSPRISGFSEQRLSNQQTHREQWGCLAFSGRAGRVEIQEADKVRWGDGVLLSQVRPVTVSVPA